MRDINKIKLVNVLIFRLNKVCVHTHRQIYVTMNDRQNNKNYCSNNIFCA